MKASIEILSDMTKRDLERLSIPSLVDPSDDGMTVSLINGSNRMRKARIAGKYDGATGQSGEYMFPSEKTKVSSFIVVVKK
tara:strand:+ start:71 stop:313 length:243 start_codon:yes stop_codon:yes gene_type:complete